ncbi:MAG: TlyA family RNA methyltransferase, partial [Raoultibacter sp.]
MKKIRLDTLLVEQGYFTDTDAALRAVLAHEVKVDDVYATSAAIKVLPEAEVIVKNRKRFASRGGHKLQGALTAFGEDVAGLRCI